MAKRHLARASKARATWGIILSMENTEFLAKERKKHGTADLLGKTECQQCGWCCLCMPCVATPDELAVIASYLDMSVRDLILTKMIIDKDEKIYYPKWARETQLDIVGTLITYDRTWDRGYCLFFDRKTHDCLIHDVRPRGARACECWNYDEDGSSPTDGWSTKRKLLKLCPDLDLSEED